MEEPRETVDLRAARSTAEAVAEEWGLSLGAPFALARYSYVAPVVGRDAVLKVPHPFTTELTSLKAQVDT